MLSFVRHIESALQNTYPPDECRALAWWVAEETTGLSRTQILSGCKDTKIIPNIEIILQRLQKKEPIQYIFGHTLWMGLDLQLSPATLIPRPETAELVDFITQDQATLNTQHSTLNTQRSTLNTQLSTLNAQHSTLNLLDIGTGSGCIAIALKQQHPDWNVYGLDISEEALAIARGNAERNHTPVAFAQCDILRQTPSLTDKHGKPITFQVVVSNPPYITEQEKQQMDASVLDYEPHSALFVPDSDPLLFYRRIAELRLAPHLYFELNEAYATQTADMLQSLGYHDIILKNDSYGKPRILAARTDLPR
ncbi:MAG: N5-glutamine methyltransferase family protein [Paludibacteraceae bacterium]